VRRGGRHRYAPGRPPRRHGGAHDQQDRQGERVAYRNRAGQQQDDRQQRVREHVRDRRRDEDVEPADAAYRHWATAVAGRVRGSAAGRVS
jgi:hypothetical protein